MLAKRLIKVARQGSSVVVNSARAYSSNTSWAGVEMGPKDPIIGLNEQFKEDSSPLKQLLGMGAYRDNDGAPYILPCVDTAERKIREMGMDHEYAPIDGIATYRAGAV